MKIGPGHALAAGFEGTAIPDDLVALAEQSGLGGVILFARNCPSLETVLALTAAARRLGPDVLVMVDHEGGRVHRLPPPFTRFPPPATVGRAGDLRLAAAVARAMARELRAAGFDSGLAPVLDCLVNPASTVIGDRAFATAPDVVSGCGVASVEAMLGEGLLPVAKHFPGHGRASVDSHQELPEIGATMDDLTRGDLVPFRAALGAGCPAVLVAHVRYPALDPELPASLSPEVIGRLLRRRLGFSGLVLSDDLEMAAVAGTWGVAGAARRFLSAGGDLALVCRRADARSDTLAAIGQDIDRGALDLAPAVRRRQAVRRLIDTAGPRPDVAVIGCAEHRALAEEVARRAAARA
ncbi:MAG: beta-N-acetylhexosaminidase [Candidatus Rokuibacteriota bacterium]|nr:MAG: beta-N-acetylhexosaminidase [Candidatus Rokubacteria bacterium]